LISAFQNQTKIDLSSYSMDEIRLGNAVLGEYCNKKMQRQLHNNGSYKRDLLSHQCKEKQCEILASEFYQSSWYTAAFDSLDESLKFLPENPEPKMESSFFDNNLRIEYRDYLYGTLYKLSFLTQLVKQFSEFDGRYLKYFRSLLQAIEQPTCHKLDKQARLIEKELSSNINYFWMTDCIIGPPTSSFSSIKEWKKFKKIIRDASIDNPNWVCEDIDFNTSSNLWMCLLFHPNHWPFLAEESLITDEELQYILSTTLGRILKIPVISLNIFQQYTRFQGITIDCGLDKIINVLISIVSKKGIDCINNTELLGLILSEHETNDTSLQAVNGYLSQLNYLPSLPPVWASAVLRLCIDATEIDTDLLLDFWEKHECCKPRFSFVHTESFLFKYNRFLEILLCNQRPSALNFCIALTASTKPNEKNQVLLQERLLANCNIFLNEIHTFHNFCYSFLNTNPCLGEFSLWTQPEIINRVHMQSNILDGITGRFAVAANPKFQIDPVKLREKLLIFIENRCDYPPTIVLAALEAILKLDEANLPILDDKVWQQCLDD
jgi:hypothetical protein